MALRNVVKGSSPTSVKSSVVHLYRSMIRELPRVMAIYDVDLPLKSARTAVTYHFRKNHAIQDTRVVNLLLAKGYMELEETLMQWKQKTHLLRILEPTELNTPKRPLTMEEKMIYGQIEEL